MPTSETPVPPVEAEDANGDGPEPTIDTRRSPPGEGAPGEDDGGFLDGLWWLWAVIGVVLGLAIGGTAWFMKKPPQGPASVPPGDPEPPEVRDQSRRLVASLRQHGLRTGAADAMSRAVDAARGSAVQPLRDAFQELDNQYQTLGEVTAGTGIGTDELLAEVRATGNLCNQRIIDAVARRLPLSLLESAERILENARNDGNEAQHLAAQRVVNELLDAVHRQYSLGPRRQ